MGLRNCIECGKICLENPSKVCPQCYELEEVYEHAVSDYLRETGKATMEEIHKATGVSEKIISRMLKSGRLFSKGLIGYPCEMCREPIYDGRLCSGCASGLSKQIQNSNEERELEGRINHQRTGMRMYTNDNSKK